jgi:hypothetical protein
VTYFDISIAEMKRSGAERRIWSEGSDESDERKE